MIDSVSSSESLKCPECRYDLTGLPTGNCPECGKAFTSEQVRAYWTHRDAPRRPSKTFLYTLAGIALLTVAALMLPIAAVTPRSFLGIISLALLLAFYGCRRNTGKATPALFAWLLFLAASTSTSAYTAIVMHDSVLIVFSLMLLQLSYCFTLIVVFKHTVFASLARLGYVVPVHGLLMLFLHGQSRSTPEVTWSDFDLWNQKTAISGTQLTVIVLFAIATNCLVIALFEWRLRILSKRSISSSSVHSPAPAPAPPSESGP